MDTEIYSAICRNNVREEMKKSAQNDSVMPDEWIMEQCNDLGINYEYEMMQIRDKEQPKENEDIEGLKKEFKDDYYLYSQGLSKLSREEINEKYKALGIKININFSRTGMKKVASDVLAREVQSSQSKQKQDYIEVDNSAQETNKSLND